MKTRPAPFGEDPQQLLKQLQADNDRLTELLAKRTRERDQAEAIKDDLVADLTLERVKVDGLETALADARSVFLPLYGGPVTPTSDPVDALIGNEVAAKHGGWPE